MNSTKQKMNNELNPLAELAPRLISMADIADHFSVSIATAHKWFHDARTLGGVPIYDLSEKRNGKAKRIEADKFFAWFDLQRKMV